MNRSKHPNSITPETDAFMTLIDDSEIDLGMVASKLSDMERQRNALLHALKLTYRKHHLSDDDIGWDELGNRLCDALCEAMGDDGFQLWLEETTAALYCQDDRSSP